MNNMYYIRDNVGMFEKYKVTYDAEKIKLLKKYVIDNCSDIKHFDYYALAQPYPSKKNTKIKNYSCLRIGSLGNYHDDFILYQYTYDEYTYNRLVILIDELLSGNYTNLDEVYNISFEYDETNKKIYECYLKLQSLINLELVDKISKADVLKVNCFFDIDTVQIQKEKKLIIKK